jgi:hypothetical protein
MTITIFGFLIVSIALFLLFRGSIGDMLILIMSCSLFGGSAALILPSLGGSSVPPAQFALLFGIARMVLPGSRYLGKVSDALRATCFLGLFGLYGVVAAIFAPIVFRGMIWVPAMRGTAPTQSLFDMVPLAPSPQNVTASVYIIGSFVVGIVAYVAMQDKGMPRRFVTMAVIMAWVHISFGVLAAVLRGTPFDFVIAFIRNGSYAMTDQTINGVVRITGVFTEPSAYAGFAFGWFVFLLECWLRDVLPRRTGPAALAMGLILFCSTSSTAYFALAGYGLILFLRTLILPQFLGITKGLTIAGLVVAAALLLSLLALTVPSFLSLVTNILMSATVGKQHSDSAMQRAMWAWSGLRAFVVSRGIGIGPGSFRSSSQITAMLGSVGVFGTAMLVAHLLRALKPLRISTYCGPREARHFGGEAMIGAAAAWAAIGVLLPASISSPTCDPGSDFAVFTAVALALRRSHSRSELQSWPRFRFWFHRGSLPITLTTPFSTADNPQTEPTYHSRDQERSAPGCDPSGLHSV